MFPKQTTGRLIKEYVIEREALFHGPFTRYVKLRIAHMSEMPGTSSPYRRQRKPLVIYPGMHYGTCVTHVLGCMPVSLIRSGVKTFPAFPAHVQPSSLRIWQEAHWYSVHRLPWLHGTITTFQSCWQSAFSDFFALTLVRFFCWTDRYFIGMHTSDDARKAALAQMNGTV